MPATKKIPVAIAYDFDGTLVPGNMQERDFIPDLKLKPAEFWKEVKSHAEENDMDEILAYMELMLERARREKISITRESFRSYGQRLDFFQGVDSWFDRIHQYGSNLGLAVKHFIISSGLREMVEGTRIAGRFEYIFASGFRYDVDAIARWPALAVNYTNKTQYLFRINKGIRNSWDNSKINKYIPRFDREIPFENMVYLGDGETDIPAMKMLRKHGGRAIAVYPPNKKGAKTNAVRLVNEEGRADAAVRADYSEGKDLEKAVKATLDEVAARGRFDAARRAGAR